MKGRGGRWRYKSNGVWGGAPEKFGETNVQGVFVSKSATLMADYLNMLIPSPHIMYTGVWGGAPEAGPRSRNRFKTGPLSRGSMADAALFNVLNNVYLANHGLS